MPDPSAAPDDEDGGQFTNRPNAVPSLGDEINNVILALTWV